MQSWSTSGSAESARQRRDHPYGLPPTAASAQAAGLQVVPFAPAHTTAAGLQVVPFASAHTTAASADHPRSHAVGFYAMPAILSWSRDQSRSTEINVRDVAEIRQELKAKLQAAEESHLKAVIAGRGDKVIRIEECRVIHYISELALLDRFGVVNDDNFERNLLDMEQFHQNTEFRIQEAIASPYYRDLKARERAVAENSAEDETAESALPHAAIDPNEQMDATEQEDGSTEPDALDESQDVSTAEACPPSIDPNDRGEDL